MSDDLQTTFSGATKGLFGAIGFILIMVGLEMMVDKEGVRLGLAVFVLLLGAICFYVAVAWHKIKGILTEETQRSIGLFAQSRATKLTVFALALFSLILSPFVEQHRWPFSYPADPTVAEANTQLKSLATANQNDAAKWRFSYFLRCSPRSSNNGLVACKFALTLSSGQNAWNLWGVLQPMLELSHWENLPLPNEARAETPFENIEVTTGDNVNARNCGTQLAKALGQAFPQKQISFRSDQTSQTLQACNNECVELSVGN